MIDAVLIGLAALCAGYFAVIVLYAGIGTSFAFIWLFFAAMTASSQSTRPCL